MSDEFDPTKFAGKAAEGVARPISFLDSEGFSMDYTQPDYLVEGIFQRRFLYSLTGQTGSGKTAIMLRLAMCVGLGDALGDLEVEPGRVLYLAGENPDDARARWIAMVEKRGVEARDVNVDFVAGSFDIAKQMEVIAARAKEVGGYALVIVDTSAAFFIGDDENSNTQLGNYARHVLRPLTTIEGGPCVIANAHPVKGATTENLVPRGGGAFLNEVDGNVTAALGDGVTELGWQGKFRGPEFTPLIFELLTVASDKLVDTKGRIHPTVVANVISATECREREDKALGDSKRVLELLADGQPRIQADICTAIGWTTIDGKPKRYKASRVMADLVRHKLVAKGLGDTYALTDKGKKANKGATP